ncbi:hypothetical protein RHMOL_Rhmol05G0271200 [Rhododendron molle]|uniref:Uncharacterized protein n=1 Tax=Rhododendron molle TaxID=49168 RepID=A0ACC0NTH2_RHOML|nr:hypothetical protein RHMOL_Rhmol05G0271200 [Rhododendron molle]
MVGNGTEVLVVNFNTSVVVILQDTSILGAESHPLHLHGFNFFIVGQGFGNFDSNNDPKKFNLVDPVEKNTVGVPSGGWVAFRFLADNPDRGDANLLAVGLPDTMEQKTRARADVYKFCHISSLFDFTFNTATTK